MLGHSQKCLSNVREQSRHSPCGFNDSCPHTITCATLWFQQCSRRQPPGAVHLPVGIIFLRLRTRTADVNTENINMATIWREMFRQDGQSEHQVRHLDLNPTKHSAPRAFRRARQAFVITRRRHLISQSEI